MLADALTSAGAAEVPGVDVNVIGPAISVAILQPAVTVTWTVNWVPAVVPASAAEETEHRADITRKDRRNMRLTPVIH
jgi:hypothetical protein